MPVKQGRILRYRCSGGINSWQLSTWGITPPPFSQLCSVTLLSRASIFWMGTSACGTDQLTAPWLYTKNPTLQWVMSLFWGQFTGQPWKCAHSDNTRQCVQTAQQNSLKRKHICWRWGHKCSLNKEVNCLAKWQVIQEFTSSTFTMNQAQCSRLSVEQHEKCIVGQC